MWIKNRYFFCYLFSFFFLDIIIVITTVSNCTGGCHVITFFHINLLLFCFNISCSFLLFTLTKLVWNLFNRTLQINLINFSENHKTTNARTLFEVFIFPFYPFNGHSTTGESIAFELHGRRGRESWWLDDWCLRIHQKERGKWWMDVRELKK